jgi:hypothetical protein
MKSHQFGLLHIPDYVRTGDATEPNSDIIEEQTGMQ